MGSSHRLISGGRYPALRSLGILATLGSIIAIPVGLYFAGYQLFAPSSSVPASMMERIGLAGLYLVGTFIVVVGGLVIAEGLKLLIDIEHNTRMAAGGAGSNGSANGSAGGVNRITALEEESAEAALIRGH